MAAPTPISLYDVNDVARVSVTFTNLAGAVTDPTTVTLAVSAPDGTVTSYTYAGGTVVKDSPGVYHADVPVTMRGDYTYVWTGTGTLTASEPGTFSVRPSTILAATALTSLGAAREYVLRDATDGTQDTMLRRLVNTYSSAVMRYTGREWLPQSTASRKFNYDGGGFLDLAPYEARAVTAVTFYTDLPTAQQMPLTVASSTVEGQWRLNPRGGTRENTYLWLDVPRIYDGRQRYAGATPWYGGYSTSFVYVVPSQNFTMDTGYEVTVTGDWGIGTVPPDVETAVLIAIKDAYENPSGYASGTEGGLQFAEDVRQSPDPNEFNAGSLPRDARDLLRPYRRGNKLVFA